MPFLKLGPELLKASLQLALTVGTDQFVKEWVRTNKGDVKIEEACFVMTTSILDGPGSVWKLALIYEVTLGVG